MAKAQREKGKRGERLMVKLLNSLGIPCKRQGWKQSKGEHYADIEFADGTKVEVKVGKQVPIKIYKWLEGNDALVVKRDREDALLIVRLKV